MPKIRVLIDGIEIYTERGTTVAAAILNVDKPCRSSVSGEKRAAMCGMGICFECRAIVDGSPHARTCQIECRDGMSVETSR